MDELLSTSTRWRTLGLRRGLEGVRVIRALHRRGDWSPEEAASELHGRRVELIGQLRRRSEGRGVPVTAQEEIVDDAITAVVMSPRGIANEHHLLGAFWLAVDHRCRRYREGRHFTRLGSRLRVEFDVAAQRISGSANPFDSLELRDRFARAADLMADLDAQERQVVSVMACNVVGPVSAARILGLPVGEARSAARSASAKLDRVAAISAAGRMCQFRAEAITADAAGEADDRQARLARAHVSACVPCGRVYRQMRREMRGREFQRAAAAAFLPAPVVSFGHAGGLERIAVWVEQRINFLPRGGGDRVAEVLGGAGVAKAAVAGTVVIAAGSALTGHVVHVIEGGHAPVHHLRSHVVQSAAQGVKVDLARDWANPTGSLIAHVSGSTVTLRAKAKTSATRRSLPKPPSKSLSYLAVGSPASASQDGSASRKSSLQSSAHLASDVSPVTKSERPTSPSQSGGGTSLSYLGR